MDVRGRHVQRMITCTLTVSDSDIRAGLNQPVQELVSAVRGVLERTEPELSADLVANGITLTGGGAMLKGLPELISEETLLEVKVAADPLDCVVRGAGRMLEHLDLLQRVSRRL